VAHFIHNCGDDFLLSVSGGTGNKQWRRDMRDRAKAVLSARTASKQADKIIDLDSWETGYADGELGRAAQCPIGCDCHPLSYSIGYYAGRKARAGARRQAPRLRYPQLSIEVRRTRPP
jgi:hypothetical protein